MMGEIIRHLTDTSRVGLIRTYPAEGMKAWKVNKLAGNGPELLEPKKVVEAAPTTLFAS